jgi:hypothetical protein
VRPAAAPLLKRASSGCKCRGYENTYRYCGRISLSPDGHRTNNTPGLEMILKLAIRVSARYCAVHDGGTQNAGDTFRDDGVIKPLGGAQTPILAKANLLCLRAFLQVLALVRRYLRTLLLRTSRHWTAEIGAGSGGCLAMGGKEQKHLLPPCHIQISSASVTATGQVVPWDCDGRQGNKGTACLGIVWA